MSSDRSKNEDTPERVEYQCAVTQCLIDVTAKQLIGLRTQCSTTEEITRKEICESESKLIRLFAKLLVAKSRLQEQEDSLPDEVASYPHTERWLSIVGLPENTVEMVVERGVTLENLLDMTAAEVERLMLHHYADEEHVTGLNTALANLRLCKEHHLKDDSSATELPLHWSSYKSASSSPYGGGSSPKFASAQRPSTSSLPPDTYSSTPSSTAPQSPASPPTAPKSTPSSPFPYHSPAELRRRLTPPATPALVKPSPKGRFRTTPPPQKKHMLCPEHFHPLTKSKSHESQLSLKVNEGSDPSRQYSAEHSHLYKRNKPGDLILNNSSEMLAPRKRSTDGSLETGPVTYNSSVKPSSPLLPSPKRSPPYKHTDSPQANSDDVHPIKKTLLNVPVSPTPIGSLTSMKHSISHRFTTRLVVGPCDLCHRHVLLGKGCKACKFVTKMVMGECNYCKRHVFRGRVCKDCKLKFHRDCAARAAPACGLPNELVDVFLTTLRGEGSPSLIRHTNSLPSDPSLIQVNSFQPSHHGGMGDSGSTTTSDSCNSSTPSSPAPFSSSATPPSPAGPSMQSTASPHIHVTADNQTLFPFSDVVTLQGSPGTVESLGTIGTIDSIGTASSITLTENSQGSADLVDVVNTNTSNDSDKSDKTLVDTGSSGENRPPFLDRVDSQESGEDGLGQSWSRVNSISLTKEWDIPYEEIEIGDKIGEGRFGSVYKGNWHGDVAIKMLSMEPGQDNQAQLQAFKLEVAMLRKTRHENLVLFMGACRKPPHLAIVTSLCKADTLYCHIHVRREKFPMNRIINYASQTAQGMGYLHAKGIVHRDLKSKNIFIENGKVVITDFGLFSVTKLCHGNRKGDWLSIPPGWLCYLAPEIMRKLQAFYHMDLPFSEASDVYAFGTIWYELMCGEWPFKGLPPEAIIWQVGRGMKQALSSMHTSRDVKEVLLMCWDYYPEKRTDFKQILHMCERLPKKRLARCPSHPIQLSRSAESVF